MLFLVIAGVTILGFILLNKINAPVAPAPASPVNPIRDSLLTKFWIDAKINFPLPREMDYERHTNGSVVFLHGQSAAEKSEKTEIFLFYFPAPVNSQSAVYLKKYAPANIKWREQLAVEVSPKSNLSARLLLNENNIDPAFIAAHLKRLDSTGDYLVLFKTPKSAFEKTKGLLIALMKEAVAQ